jgi:radical SAM protein with 4Fe4S-binding SPASM domain
VNPEFFKNLGRLWAMGSAFRNRKTVLPYFPSRLWIEVTSHCNLRCPLCPNRDLPPEKKGFLDFDLFKEAVDQSAGRVHDLYLFHRGEPLLHPRLAEMIAYAEHRGIPSRIHTNATLLTASLAGKLLDSGLRWLSFSFDGYDATTYERNRPPARFTDTLSRIERFLILKKGRKLHRMTTVLQIMGLPAGTKDPRLSELTRRLKSLGLDRVVYRRPHNWGGLISPSSTSFRTPPRLGCCTFPWYALVIYWDGTVGPCPQDFQGEMILGKVGEQNLTEIWNGPAMKQLRQLLARKAYQGLKVCAVCDRPRRPQIAGVPLEYARTFLRDKLLG